MNLTKEEILGVKVNSDSEDKILEYIEYFLINGGKKLSIFTPNPEIVVKAARDREFQKVLNSANIALPDGVGIIIGAFILGRQLQKRITGVDFVFRLCELSARLNKTIKEEKKSHSKTSKQPVTIGFLGGQSGVAEYTADCLQKKYPGVIIAYASDEWRNKKNQPLIDILFVAFGAPKQEEWISNNINNIPVRIAMGVGGSFDYISGKVVWAPWLMRFLGFEWLFRLATQPWRWRRQLALVEFAKLVFLETLKKKITHFYF